MADACIPGYQQRAFYIKGTSTEGLIVKRRASRGLIRGVTTPTLTLGRVALRLFFRRMPQFIVGTSALDQVDSREASIFRRGIYEVPPGLC